MRVSTQEFVRLFTNLSFTYDFKKKRYVCDEICCFDTETTSYLLDEEKIAFPYAYILSIKDKVCIVRHKQEFIYILNQVSRNLDLSEKRILIFWVHNLKFDFQFIRKLIDWEYIFALKTRTVCEALTKNGICFRCSYLMSNVSLEVIGQGLIDSKMKKLVGNLDYTLSRNSKTLLSDKELDYMEHDCLVLYNYIKEEIKYSYGCITNLPITNTAKVRNYCREKCLENPQYPSLMKKLQLNLKDYLLCEEAFAGGFTHANSRYVRKTLDDVRSYDITSDYPTEMILEKYPMSSPMHAEINSEADLLKYSKKFLSIFRVQISGLREKFKYEHMLSKHKCKCIGEVVDNGRIVSADFIETVITNIDFESLKQFYDWDSNNIKISDFIYFQKDYLPTEIVDSILTFYEAKTQLKGIESKEKEYMNKKNMLNSIYGMMVTDIIRDEITYVDNEWDKYPKERGDILNYTKEKLNKYNSSRTRFLYYPWGIFVTSYARRRLFRAILTLGKDYVYADTDSVKFKELNSNNHKYFKNEDITISLALKYVASEHKIPVERLSPVSVKGIPKPLGVWSDEGLYKKFKTLGAKRYLVKENNNKLIMTVAGIPKKAVRYLRYKQLDGVNPFDIFDTTLEIPIDFSKKLASVHIDEKREGFVKDFQGNTEYVVAESGLYLSPIPARLSICETFLQYLFSLELFELE